MSNKEAEVGLDMDALLASSIDDIVDLPGFEVPVPGQYQLEVSFSQKMIKDVKMIEASYEVIETLELADPTAIPPLPGTKFSQLFDPKNIYALDNFKRISRPIYKQLGCSSYTDFFDQASNIVIVATVKRRADKNDPDKFYPDVKNVTVV